MPDCPIPRFPDFQISRFLRDFLAALFFPVGFEHRLDLADDGRVLDDDADLAPIFELEPAQALAADEGLAAVADDGADVQAQVGELTDLDVLQRFLERADDPDLDAGPGPF